MVLVDDGTSTDALGLIGIAEGRECFVIVGGGDTGYHGSFGISAEGVF